MAGVAKQAFGRVTLKLIEHLGHGHQETSGFGRYSGVMHHRADQEDDEITFEFGRPPARLKTHSIKNLSSRGRCLQSQLR